MISMDICAVWDYMLILEDPRVSVEKYSWQWKIQRYNIS